MVKLKALSTIDHDGKRYKAGDTLTVADDDAAQPLIAGGAAEPIADAKPAKDAK